jgi:hypothetical protein
MDELALLHGLRELVDGTRSLLHVPAYFDPQRFAHLVPALQTREPRSTSSIYQTDGIALFDALRQPSLLAQYLKESPIYSAELRSLFKPSLSPVDEFRLFLEDFWFSGSCLLPFGHQQARFGLVRIWQTGSEARPHQDLLRRECPELPISQRVRVQLGFNAYLATGEAGGDLQVWKTQLSDTEWRSAGIDGSYGLEQFISSPADNVVAPVAGDILLVNTECIHAVSRVESGCRVTLSGFIGYVDESSPLYLWS